ncbi:MAG: helix-turn-helix transcriptional regulator [Marinilabiliaceae bacterium]|nr:helix-turn-helix transcriptional regulator [Marinilabiliaceae bacterium]
MPPQIAIITANALTGLGLQTILQSIMPSALVSLFASFEELESSEPEVFVHLFVSSDIYISHPQFFKSFKSKTFVLTCNTHDNRVWQGVRTLDVNKPHKELIDTFSRMFSHAHGNREHFSQFPEVEVPETNDLLSPRECEVLREAVRGLTNKEIGDKLCISLPTVISHRKNLCDKLGIRTLSGLTIYAIANNIIETSEIK